MQSTLKPPTLYKVSLAAMVILYFVLPQSRVVPFPANLLGLIPLFFGAQFASSAKKQFIKAQTPVSPTSDASALIIDGAYRYSRNPMYLGITIGLFGAAIALSSYWNYLFPIGFAVIIDRFFIPHEEAAMLRIFGEDYTAYCSETRRWL